MVSKKALAIGGTVTVVIVVVIVVPSVLLTKKAEFRKTFMEKCLEFPKEKHICEKAWVLFEQAYVEKDPDTVTPDNYKELFDAFPFNHPCEKSLLWSNTSDLVKLVDKGKCYVPIGHTMLGYVLDDLKWCGKNNSNETFTGDKCKGVIKPYNSFWTTASIRLAQHACGEVKVLLNGEKDNPYDINSFFRRFEVPYLEHPRVMKLDVILAVEKEGRPGCSDESLKNLKNYVEQKKIVYDCKEMFESQVEKILNTC